MTSTTGLLIMGGDLQLGQWDLNINILIKYKVHLLYINDHLSLFGLSIFALKNFSLINLFLFFDRWYDEHVQLKHKTVDRLY